MFPAWSCQCDYRKETTAAAKDLANGSGGLGEKADAESFYRWFGEQHMPACRA